MTSSASRIEDGRLTLSDLQTVRFHESKGFGRGYDEAEVDAFMARCASELQRLTRRVDELEAQASSSAMKDRRTDTLPRSRRRFCPLPSRPQTRQ